MREHHAQQIRSAVTGSSPENDPGAFFPPTEPQYPLFCNENNTSFLHENPVLLSTVLNNYSTFHLPANDPLSLMLPSVYECSETVSYLPSLSNSSSLSDTVDFATPFNGSINELASFIAPQSWNVEASTLESTGEDSSNDPLHQFINLDWDVGGPHLSCYTTLDLWPNN